MNSDELAQAAMRVGQMLNQHVESGTGCTCGWIDMGESHDDLRYWGHMAVILAVAARKDVAETVREALLAEHINEGACPGDVDASDRDPSCAKCALIPAATTDRWHSFDGQYYPTRGEAAKADVEWESVHEVWAGEE